MDNFDHQNNNPTNNQPPRSSIYDDLMEISKPSQENNNNTETTNSNSNNNVDTTENNIYQETSIINDNNEKEVLTSKQATIRILLLFFVFSFIFSFIKKFIPTGISDSTILNIFLSTLLTSIFRIISWKSSIFITFGKHAINKTDINYVIKNIFIIMLIIIILSLVITSSALNNYLKELGTGFDTVKEFYEFLPEETIQKNESLIPKYDTFKNEVLTLYIVSNSIQAVADLIIIKYLCRRL